MKMRDSFLVTSLLLGTTGVVYGAQADDDPIDVLS